MDLAGLELNERQREILQAIIEEYIARAEPVGSRTLTKRRGLTLSPATVRNVMSDLESLGLLSAPHASAGRTPTPLAFRLFVDRLAQRGRINANERELIESVAQKHGSSDLASLLHDAGQVLSAVSKKAALVLLPSLSDVIFEHIELIAVRSSAIMVIFVAKSGLVQNRVVEMDFTVSKNELRQMSNYLNSLLEGKTLGEVRKQVLASMNDERAAADRLMSDALRIGQKALEGTDIGELVVTGERRFLEQPEFMDVDRMRRLMRAFESKTILLQLLDTAESGQSSPQAAQDDETRVSFSDETSESDGLAMVTAAYGSDDGAGGRVAVVGPTRMDYGRVIPLVELTAKVVSGSLSGPQTEEAVELGVESDKEP